MYFRLFIAGLSMCLLLGCSKKPSRMTGSQDNSSPPPPNASLDKGNSQEKNKKPKDIGLTDSRSQKDSERPLEETGGLPGKPGFGMKIPKPEGGWTATQPPAVAVPGQAPIPNSAPAKPEASASGKTPELAAQPVSEQDMKDVWIYIENRSGASCQMPSPQEVLAALELAKSPAAALVKNGSIVLTGPRMRESIWAFEANAPLNGGWTASTNGAQRLTAKELNTRLAGR